MAEHGMWTRRALFRGLLGTFGAAMVPQMEEQHRIHAQAALQPGAGPAPEQLTAALQQKVESLQGLDPAAFLTAFDSGRVVRDGGGRPVREFELVARDAELEIAPGLRFPAWTFNGSVPGPTLRCQEGERVRIRFVNRSLTEHTVHLHGLHPANMDGVMEPVAPGGSYLYEFVAEPAGLQLYHCHVPPVALHMNRGLFGALLIDRRSPRPPATEMVMILHGWDLDFDERNELYALNGGVNYYRDHPVVLRRDERVRIYLINALEYDPIGSFHLHANFFSLDRHGSAAAPRDWTDMVMLCQAERCILEFSYRETGHFMFHPHQNHMAERGAMGVFQVTA